VPPTTHGIKYFGMCLYLATVTLQAACLPCSSSLSSTCLYTDPATPHLPFRLNTWFTTLHLCIPSSRHRSSLAVPTTSAYIPPTSAFARTIPLFALLLAAACSSRRGSRWQATHMRHARVGKHGLANPARLKPPLPCNILSSCDSPL